MSLVQELLKPKLSKSALETKLLGKKLSAISSPSIILLFGDLGAGKTTLVKGFVEGLGGMGDEVQSPTFIYLNIYETKKMPVYHFDLYRLASPEEFLEKGFEEYFSNDGICILEWPERIFSILPTDAICLYLEYVDKTTRSIHLKSNIL